MEGRPDIVGALFLYSFMNLSGYSGTPLVKKLGIKPHQTILVWRAPEDYWTWISPLPEKTVVKGRRGKGPLDFVHLFVQTNKVFEKELLRHKEVLAPNGMIWISWPKKSSGVETDLNENVIRNFALKNDLVDVKVCSVDEVWSGLKLVIPVGKRVRQNS